MKKSLFASIGIIALTATGCALPIEAKEASSTPTQEAPTQAPAQDTMTPKDAYLDFVAMRGVYTRGGYAYGIGLRICESFDSQGYLATVSMMVEANNEAESGLSSDELAAMAVGSAKYLCPEHEEGFRKFAAS